MNNYRVGFKWKDGTEYYVTMKTVVSQNELSESLLKQDKTGNLVAVYVKPTKSK